MIHPSKTKFVSQTGDGSRTPNAFVYRALETLSRLAALGDRDAACERIEALRIEAYDVPLSARQIYDIRNAIKSCIEYLGAQKDLGWLVNSFFPASTEVKEAETCIRNNEPTFFGNAYNNLPAQPPALDMASVVAKLRDLNDVGPNDGGVSILRRLVNDDAPRKLYRYQVASIFAEIILQVGGRLWAQGKSKEAQKLIQNVLDDFSDGTRNPDLSRDGISFASQTHRESLSRIELALLSLPDEAVTPFARGLFNSALKSHDNGFNRNTDACDVLRKNLGDDVGEMVFFSFRQFDPIGRASWHLRMMNRFFPPLPPPHI